LWAFFSRVTVAEFPWGDGSSSEFLTAGPPEFEPSPPIGFPLLELGLLEESDDDPLLLPLELLEPLLFPLLPLPPLLLVEALEPLPLPLETLVLTSFDPLALPLPLPPVTSPELPIAPLLPPEELTTPGEMLSLGLASLAVELPLEVLVEVELVALAPLLSATLLPLIAELVPPLLGLSLFELTLAPKSDFPSAMLLTEAEDGAVPVASAPPPLAPELVDLDSGPLPLGLPDSPLLDGLLVAPEELLLA